MSQKSFINSISILGCGWLGLPLAKSLLNCGIKVKGSVTECRSFSLLEREGIAPYLLKCDPDISGENIEGFFNADTLIITLPFKRDFKEPEFYKRQIDAVIAKVVEVCVVKFVVFTSSTSIYPANLALAEEDADFTPDNNRSGVLFDIEQSLLKNKNFFATIVRCAGLYGGTRQIGRFLAGKKDLANGEQPANLVHQEDCVGILTEIVKQDVQGEIFNACSDVHPLRKELYAQEARKLGLPAPTFSPGNQTQYKIVSNAKVKEKLKYQFIHNVL